MAGRHRASRPAVLAVDGGDSKTALALVARDGSLLTAMRVPRSSHVGLGKDGASFEALSDVIREACSRIGIELDGTPVAQTGVYCLAGDDLPADDRRIEQALRLKGWTASTLVRNDTFAVLRAGTDRRWGVGVVCGTGMNCSGVGPGGKVVRFAALGEISGDAAAGGGWLGRNALGAAIRARDGRGARTVLERLVPAHFGLARPSAVMEAVYVGRIDEHRLSELPPLVFRAAAAGDLVAGALLERVADEVVAMAGAAIRRLRLQSRDVEVILGGGLFHRGDGPFLDRVRLGIESIAPRAAVRRLGVPPVIGAALLGLDHIGAAREAGARLRLSSASPGRKLL
jgi:N-acetylglucosamine kinase-like BadF-type ATPase